MASAKSKTKKNSDGYSRNKLLSVMNKPGDNIADLSKELKKLAAFMRNTKSKTTEEVPKEISINKKEPEIIDNTLSTIDNFLESNGVEEISLDDILKSEGYSSDYFSMSDNIEEDMHSDNQIDSINSFLDAVENGDFKRSNDSYKDDEESIDDLEEEEYCKPIEETFNTESLAHIYIKQRKYERALEIIKGISLKNPEKNIYFADQIRFLEKLIINIKTK